ncbi:hypothetical protein [Alkalibacillus haloalkaliphilus]|uniref:hypothetical protein n=1 Tax=Alkalibacillus haloalkaliphilus TaxID=94136 RepID=UPI002936A7C2|nr:hypothetical protein [Alkalibacillus haloalkaliphilus]MDV2581692.1 hypothetical protein [Alkalibacillus haloalkaliphilus]
MIKNKVKEEFLDDGLQIEGWEFEIGVEILSRNEVLNFIDQALVMSDEKEWKKD